MDDAVDYPSGVAAAVRKIAAVKNQVRFLPAEIGNNGVEGREVTVNVRENGDAHGRSNTELK
jgi:hypothetical protein